MRLTEAELMDLDQMMERAIRAPTAEAMFKIKGRWCNFDYRELPEPQLKKWHAMNKRITHLGVFGPR